MIAHCIDLPRKGWCFEHHPDFNLIWQIKSEAFGAVHFAVKMHTRLHKFIHG